MSIFTIKFFLATVFIVSFSPFNCYSETIVDANSKMTFDKSCVTNGMNNIKTKFTNITEADAQYISTYGCFCAYKAAQKSSLAVEATDFRNGKNCIHYAVLRNAIRYLQDSDENLNGEQVKKMCMASFPHDLSDDSMNEDIASFCNCAGIPTEQMYHEMKPVKQEQEQANENKPKSLNEEQIYEQLISIINSCRYSI